MPQLDLQYNNTLILRIRDTITYMYSNNLYLIELLPVHMNSNETSNDALDNHIYNSAASNITPLDVNINILSHY